MGSWGATTSDESKPKYLTDEAKRDVYATTAGWTQDAQGISAARIAAGADREVLVAIRGLSGAAKLGHATISSANWISQTLNYSGTTNAELQSKISINWNEPITVPSGANIVLTITSPNISSTTLDMYCYDGSVDNRAVFQVDFQPSGTDTNWEPESVLSIAAQSIVGSVTPAGTEVAISAAVASGAGPVIVGP